MRTLTLILVLIFSVSISAQSPSVLRLFNDGTGLAKVGSFAEASRSYRESLTAALDENVTFEFLARSHYNIGVCEYKLGHAPEAIREFEQAIDLRSGDYSQATYALGMVHLENQNWTDAEDAFLATIRLDKKNGEAWFDLGFAYLGQGDLEHAESAFRASIALKSVDAAWSHNNIGVLLALKGDVQAAEREFKSALKLSGGVMTKAKANLEYCRSVAGEPKLLANNSLTFLGGGRSGI